MSETNYRIKYKKGDFEVDVQGDKSWVETKFSELTSKEVVVASAKVQERAKTMPSSLGDFLETKGAGKQTDDTAVFAYWLLKSESVESFNANDMLNCYERTRKTKPKNINATIDKNVSRHIFDVAREKKDGLKAWVLTQTGEKYVEQMKT
jgi:hypothetical protein